MYLPGTVPVCSVPGRSIQHDAHLRAKHRTSLFVTIATGRIGTDLPKQPGSDFRCEDDLRGAFNSGFASYFANEGPNVLPGTVPVCSVPGRTMHYDAHLRASHRTSLFVTTATLP